MTTPDCFEELLIAKAQKDAWFRKRLLTSSRTTIEQELGIRLPSEHEVQIHEDSAFATHLVLPPSNRFSEAEREEARTGGTSLSFLRKTLHDPAPPLRPVEKVRARNRVSKSKPELLVGAGQNCIQRGLAFLESALDERGAWHCIRFNVADPNIPRHYERPPFISAFCALALENSKEIRARDICSRTKSYLADTIEYPGLWRYYRHVPTDLDSTTLCSMLIGSHPWIQFGRNVSTILKNRDENGLFLTWVHADGEPEVVAPFRIEADPVVNANVVAYLGDRPETKAAQEWLTTSIVDGTLAGASKWYPDLVAVYYATSRAIVRAQTDLQQSRGKLAEQILALRDEAGDFGNILQASQAVSSLYNIKSLVNADAIRQLEMIVDMQHDDGSWPELLAFGDQSLSWGKLGEVGHGSETVTSAFCIEALERLVETLSV